MNKAESERLGNRLEQEGYQATNCTQEADLIVLNSCVVRQSAENRVINKLNALKPLKMLSPKVTLAVTGCLVTSENNRLQQRFSHVDYFFPAGGQPPWLKEIKSKSILPHHICTFVPIIQGCNNCCSYCIVPYRRGKEKSRPINEIISEVQQLVFNGVREVTLLGQNVDSFGHDLFGKPDLADLLRELNNIDGLARIRYLTNHPKDMSNKLIDAISRLEKVCEQINLPVQSGSDEILAAMKRSYSSRQYRRLLAQIRNKIPEVAISTDIIVGFPSESEEQFYETSNLLSELKFDTVHVAAYSPREGTTASNEYKDNISPDEKKRRLRAIEHLQENIAREINARLLGRTVEILVEGRKKEKWYGRTRTGKLVFFNSTNDCLGQLVITRIEKTGPWSMQGKL
jgi:tRNA-2-methylthio-N6-dimethylallyladenosine synthase